MRRRIFAWTVDADAVSTRKIYERLQSGAASRCGCAACLNFGAARPAHFPEAFRYLLDTLEIDPCKEASVRLVSPLEGERNLYAGTYGFCGTLLAGRPFRGFPIAKEEVDVFERVGPDTHAALKVWQNPPAPWAEGPCVRLEFLAVLPWVLTGPNVPLCDLSRPPKGSESSS